MYPWPDWLTAPRTTLFGGSEHRGETQPTTSDPMVMHPKYRSFRNMDGYGNVQATPICEFGHQGLMHDEEFMVTGMAGSNLIYNRARTLNPGLGRFVQRDDAGYVDGMNLYNVANNNPNSLLDPSGNVVFFVHGINNWNITEYPHVYDGMKSYWTDNGFSDQDSYQFLYGNPPDIYDAMEGISGEVNQNAAWNLAHQISLLHSELTQRGCDEPINLIAYSNGSYVVFVALNQVANIVDRTIFIGAALNRNYTHDHHIINPVPLQYQIVNFWSESDGVVGIWGVNGIGRYGMRPNVSPIGFSSEAIADYEISGVYHSESVAFKKGLVIEASEQDLVEKKTHWMTHYMGRHYYGPQTATTATCYFRNSSFGAISILDHR